MRTTRVLLACGIGSSLLYLATDLVASSLLPGYRYAHQAVSELSAIGAPTRTMWQASGALYEVLLIAFAWGVWRAASHQRSLRVLAVLVVCIGVLGIIWGFFPMHGRGTTPTESDRVHAVIAGINVILVLSGIFVSTRIGPRFRIYAIASAILMLVAGAATFLYVPRIDARLPTPGLGLVERVNVYGYLVWIS
jgi:hypothetical membrane protein